MTEQEFRRLAIQAVEDYHNKNNAPYAISKDNISSSGSAAPYKTIRRR